MLWGQWQGIPAVSSDHGSDPFKIGGRTSYVPSLGPIVAEAQKSGTFHWYIYRHPKGHLVGYVRIPHYMGDNEVFADFKKVIARFEQATDALVIDQINNPGGSLFYVMALMSVLSDRPMSVPDQHIALFPSILNELHELEEQTKDVRSDADARKALKAELIDGYPVDLQLVQGIRTFAREVKAEWSARRRLTRPLNYMGVDKVNPDADVHYGKPILVLTNEMDFSGGDFFPAILQDNRRVKILGQRTSGAGGYVIPVEFPSGLGLSVFSFTGSLARRLNNDPIENLGVVPDIPYELTVRDLTEGFPDYRDAINSAVGTQIH